MANVKILKTVERPFPAFRDRQDAGRVLTGHIDPEPTKDAAVLALPRGGIPVGEPLADRLNATLEPVPVRKLPIPSSPEMGFGAVAIDGSRILNERVVRHFRISQAEIESATEEVLAEVRRRAREYGGTQLSPDVKGKAVYLVDDGLATGFSMVAAATMVRKLEPRLLVLAVPVSPLRSFHAVEEYFDEIYCLYAQAVGSFAVASFYRDFHDLSDDEVHAVLQRRRSAI